MANKELRDAKIAAHAAFDRLWKSGQMQRGDAYRKLAAAMGMTKDECHVGEMDLEQARRVPEVLKGIARY